MPMLYSVTDTQGRGELAVSGLLGESYGPLDKNNCPLVRFQALTAASIKMTVF
jgi:hypothetical protein